MRCCMLEAENLVDYLSFFLSFHLVSSYYFGVSIFGEVKTDLSFLPLSWSSSGCCVEGRGVRGGLVWGGYIWGLMLCRRLFFGVWYRTVRMVGGMESGEAGFGGFFAFLVFLGFDIDVGFDVDVD